MALVAIGCLLLFALALPGIDEQLGLRRLCDGTGRRLLHDDIAGWRCHYGIALRTLHVIGVVGVVVGHTTHPDCAVERRQHGDHDADRRRDDDKPSWGLGAVPDAGGKIELHAAVNDQPGARGQRSEHVPVRRVVPIVMVARIQELMLMKLVLAKLMLAIAVLLCNRRDSR